MDLHLHTTFSDGRNEMVDYVEAALKIGYTQIAFTDHVCDYTNYLEEYIDEITRLRKKYGAKLKILAGIESKVINLEGELDLPSDFHLYQDSFDLIFAAFHQIPNGDRKYFSSTTVEESERTDVLLKWFSSMLNTLQNPIVSGVVHPTSVLRKYSIMPDQNQKRAIAETAFQNNTMIEINLRHAVPDKEFLNILKDQSTELFIGSDSHSVKSFQYFAKQITDLSIHTYPLSKKIINKVIQGLENGN